MPPTETTIFFCVTLVWLMGWVLASVRFRISRGKPIFPSVPDDFLYAERWGSGRNLAVFLGRLGGANNCLIIVVTADRLIVTPRFPFNLSFLPELFGLEFDRPIAQIANVAKKRFLLRDVAEISFSDGKLFQLYPRHIDDFMAALRTRGA